MRQNLKSTYGSACTSVVLVRTVRIWSAYCTTNPKLKSLFVMITRRRKVPNVLPTLQSMPL